jgi:transporter family protein
MPWIYLICIAVLWGVGNVLVKRGLTHLSAWQSYALDAVFIAFPLWMVYGVINKGNLLTITPLAIVTTILISIFYGFNYISFSQGDVSLTGSIISTYPIITLILAFVFLHERLNTLATLGVVLTILGVVAISVPHKRVHIGSWVYLAVLTSVGYGVTAYMGKLVLNTMNNATYLMLLAITQVLVVVVWKLLIRDTIPRVRWNKYKFSIIGIILLNIGNIAYYIALEQGLASLVVPLSSTYVLLMVLLSVAWLKEKVYGHQLVGIALAVAGVVMAGFFSGI